MHWFAGKALERGDIAREVAVRSILEGSVRRQEHRLRVSAQLYDPKADKQVWAERYERDIDDLLAVQDDISEKVVAAISAKLLAGALTRQVRTYTPNIEAYDLYIRGRAAGIPPTPSNIAKASELF
jgi:adenylate cyclase